MGKEKTLIRADVVPPGGWRYTQKETGELISANTHTELISKVRVHRRTNGLTIPADLAKEVEQQICEWAGSSYCANIDLAVSRERSASLTWGDIVKGTRILASWVMSGTPRVNEAEAERRAEICVACPMNIPAPGCVACAGSKLTRGLIGGKTKHDKKLKNCGICKCVNRAQVWLPLDVLSRSLDSAQYQALPDFCWK